MIELTDDEEYTLQEYLKAKKRFAEIEKEYNRIVKAKLVRKAKELGEFDYGDVKVTYVRPSKYWRLRENVTMDAVVAEVPHLYEQKEKAGYIKIKA